MKRSPLKRKTRLNRVSPRKRALRADYAKVSAEHLAEYPRCQIGPRIKAAGYQVDCWDKATHVHHVKHRGKYLCDRNFFLSSCSGECHPKFIHQTNVKEAYELGLLQ